MSKYFVLLLCFALLSLSATPSMAKSRDSVLGNRPIGKYYSSDLAKWNHILKQHPIQKAKYRSEKTDNWNKLIQEVKGQPKIRQMMRVNMWFEQYPYKYDPNVYKQKDYWATPLEFLEYGGDCEDYAIAKYMTLRQLGFPASSMKITMVYDGKTMSDHAFLIVDHDGIQYVMDNREKLVVARYMENRYMPHFAFNEDYVWTYDSPLITENIRAYGSKAK